MARSELRDEIAASGVPHEPADFSLVLGGPLYLLFLRTSLARHALEPHWWRVIAFMLICCFPPLLFSLLASHLVGGVSVPFLFDVEIHTRCLGMLPLLIASEWIVHDRLQNRAKFKEFVASAMRLRNSTVVEIVILFFAITGAYWLWSRYATMGLSRWCNFRVGGEMHDGNRGEPLLGTSDLQSLADLGSAYTGVSV
jgi:hypothetical protein